MSVLVKGLTNNRSRGKGEDRNTFRTCLARGFTLVEVMVGLAIVGLLVSVALPSYHAYFDKIDLRTAQGDIKLLSLPIQEYIVEYGVPPANLGPNAGFLDPWGNPYVFYNVQTGGIGGARKDQNLNPINSDFDLYSKGKDGLSVKPLPPPKSHDDVIRANNGGFVGLAKDY